MNDSKSRALPLGDAPLSAKEAPDVDPFRRLRTVQYSAVYSALKLIPGLQLELTQGRTTYRARAHAHGAVGYHNTRTSDLAEATASALAWFARWQREQGPKTMAEAASLHASRYDQAQAAARRDFLKRWSAIADVQGLGAMPVSRVTADYLAEFVVARGALTGNTKKKDLDTIRPILRTAMDAGWIDALPRLPKARVVKNPRLPFSRQEWRTLQAACIDPDVSDFMHVIVLGLLRPHEVLRLTVGDVADDGKTMRIHVRRKTGLQHAPVPVRFETLRAILRLRRDSCAKGGYLRLFPFAANWFPRQFGKLLDATGLRQPLGTSCRPRDSWSLRATGICLEIQRQRRKHGAADYLRIARWAGTSISRIDGHYAAFLG